MSAERHASAAVKASTRQSSARSSDTVLCHVLNCCTRSALLHDANTSPTAAPVTATIRLSMKSSRAIRQRELPSARRTLNSRRRASVRASMQTGDVGARDEQHEPDGDDHREERRFEARCAATSCRSRPATRVNGSELA